MEKKLRSGPGNAKYIQHDIQNKLLAIIAEIIRKDIASEVMEAEHFALMVDETKDVSKQEQLPIVVRYLHEESIHEEFLDFTAAEGLNADSLTSKILRHGLDAVLTIMAALASALTGLQSCLAT